MQSPDDGLRVIGQAMNTLIIAETAHCGVVIDQHVSQERVLNEYLCSLRAPTATEKQRLLFPKPSTSPTAPPSSSRTPR